MSSRLVLASQLLVFLPEILASSPVCSVESEGGAGLTFCVLPFEQEDAAISESSDLSLIQVSATARVRGAKLDEELVKTEQEAEVEFKAAPNAEPFFSKATPAADTDKKRSRSKSPPVALDKIIETGPGIGKMSLSAGSVGKVTARTDTAATSDSSAAVISRLESRVEDVERQNANLQEAVDASEKTSTEISRLERRLGRVERESAGLKQAAQTAMPARETKEIRHKKVQHVDDNGDDDDHEDADAYGDDDDDDGDSAELDATIQKSHDESARLEATINEVRKARKVQMQTKAHDAKRNRSQEVASRKATDDSSSSSSSSPLAAPHHTVFSALKIHSATDSSSPTVLLGGLNFSGDPSATDDEEPLMNVSLVEDSGFSIAFTASWHRFHPFCRLLSLSDGNKDILRVSGSQDSDTLSFSVRRCQHDGHVCNHDASVNVKRSIVANATDRFLCTVSPRGKMEVYKNGQIIGRLRPDGTYAVEQRGGQSVPSAETRLYMARRTWRQRKRGVPPFEGYIGDVCFWSREVAFAEAVSCVSHAS